MAGDFFRQAGGVIVLRTEPVQGWLIANGNANGVLHNSEGEYWKGRTSGRSKLPLLNVDWSYVDKYEIVWPQSRKIRHLQQIARGSETLPGWLRPVLTSSGLANFPYFSKPIRF